MHHLFHFACPLCHGRSAKHGLCRDCLQDFSALQLSKEHCPLCKEPSIHGNICGACIQKPPPIDALDASLRYEEPLRLLLTRWKNQGLMQLSSAITELLTTYPAKFRQPEKFDYIVPMPVSRLRLIEHGFHHTLLLAEAASHIFNVPVLPTAAIVRQHRPPQSSLSSKERKNNLRHAFTIQQAMTSLRLLIIDDVSTTGSSINELAVSLKKAGAARVCAWTLAKTLLHD